MSLTLVSSRFVFLGLYPIAGHPREPRHAVLPAGIEAHVLHVVDEIGLVGELGVIERGHVSEPDHASGHPVGEHDDVAVDALVALERLVDLGEELVVVVDVLRVLDLDARGLLEVGHRLLVDVQRPVGYARASSLRPLRRLRPPFGAPSLPPHAARKLPPSASPPAPSAVRARKPRRLTAWRRNSWMS